MIKRSFKFFDTSFRNLDASTKYLTIIGHHPAKNFPHNFNHLIDLSDNVILADSGANAYLAFMKTHSKAPLPAFISGDMDSIKKETVNFFENNNVPCIDDPNQDINDVEKTLLLTTNKILPNIFKDEYAKCRIMIWGLAGHRFDQLMYLY